jgi:hypothetical protein
MTPEERNLISSLFDRLGQASNQPKDAEADQLIRSKVAEIPTAPYMLVQSTLVMQQALANAQNRIAALEKQVAETKTGAGSQQTGGSFLSGVASFFGGGQAHGQPPQASPPPPPPPPPAMQAQPPPAMQAQPPQPTAYGYPPAAPRSGTGGFLQGALTTAAGVAGGALLFQGIEGLIGHNPGPFAGAASPSGGFLGGERPVENTEITNNYYTEGDESRDRLDPREADADQGRGDQSAYADADTDRDSDLNATDDLTSADDNFTDDDTGGGDDSSYV